MKFSEAITFAILSTAGLSNAATTISLGNAGFQDSGQDTNPPEWTVTEALAGGAYVYATGGGIPSGTNVLAFQARNGTTVSQAFSGAEATVGDFSSYTVSFDAGWRNNTAATNDITIRFSLWNFTTDSEIDGANYTLPPDSPSNATDTYRVVTTGETVTLNDSGANSGDEIGLRMTTITSRNSFNPTGWVDNISVTAVPEPSTGLLALAGFALLARRRR